MTQYRKISIEEAKKIKSKRRSKSTLLEEYKERILNLEPNMAGAISIKNDKEGYAIRNRILRAAKALKINVDVKKRGNEILFWKSDWEMDLAMQLQDDVDKHLSDEDKKEQGLL